MSEPLYGDKALELFFGGNPSGVATAIRMRDDYEAELAALRARVAELELEQISLWHTINTQTEYIDALETDAPAVDMPDDVAATMRGALQGQRHFHSLLADIGEDMDEVLAATDAALAWLDATQEEQP